MSPVFMSRHALEGRVSGFSTFANADHLSILRRPAIISVMAHAGHEATVETALRAMPEASLRFCGPGQWLVVSEERSADALLGDVAALEQERVSAVDSGDGYVLMRLAGPNARRILAKCVAVDVHRDVFFEGQSANALLAHASANLARTGADQFDIVVSRSLALVVFDEVMEMGREFELTAGFSD